MQLPDISLFLPSELHADFADPQDVDGQETSSRANGSHTTDTPIFFLSSWIRCLGGTQDQCEHEPVRRFLALSGWEVDVVVFLARVFQRRLS
jgi:hypothetical protein